MNVAVSAAASGISAGLSMLDAAAGNIANADTPGYAATAPQLTSQPGAGVTVAGYAATSDGLSSQLPDAFLAGLMVRVNAVSLRTAMTAYASIGFSRPGT